VDVAFLCLYGFAEPQIRSISNVPRFLILNTMKRILLLISTFTLCPLTTFAQFRQYGTRDYVEFLKSKDASDKPFSDEKAEIKLPITLSITFVLLTKEVSKDQLLKQIKSLNQDFSNQTFEDSKNQSLYYKQLATDTETRFCENFEVIEAYTDEKIDFALGQEYARKFNLTSKNGILVFVTDLEKMAGYAQMPGYAAETDAIFIDKSYLIGINTESYDLGKTLTHLVGSYLGLGELWGCVDDGVFDTPMHNVLHTNANASLSSCYDFLIHEMPENFMDGTPDKFQNMFTLGQKQKMLFELSTRRKNLLEFTTCK
jgi:Pregnancy-associated plasma protein-A